MYCPTVRCNVEYFSRSLEGMLQSKNWDWICNILPKKIVLHNLNSINLLVNLHNQQTWSPDHCFFQHLPSHLALYKNIVISLQTLSKELTIHKRLAPENTHLHRSFSVDTSPTPTPWKFPGSCILFFKTFGIWHPLPWYFHGVSMDCHNWDCYIIIPVIDNSGNGTTWQSRLQNSTQL